MSKYTTSERTERQPLRAAAIGWRLCLTFWVGGLWLLYFVMVPALEHYGLAPILISDLAGRLMLLLMGLSAVCVLLQLLLLAAVVGRRLLADLRGQLLLASLLLVAGYLAGHWLAVIEHSVQLFCYLASAACGLSLLLLPVPGERSEA